MTAKTTLLALAVATASSLFAQQRTCLSHTITERWLQAHDQHIDLAHEASVLEQGGMRSGGVQTIPVVVHVVWNTNAENISDADILEVLDQMNQDYQAMNGDYGNVRPQFTASRGNALIDFCLATVDPDGNPTTGITRFQTTETWFDPDTQTDDMKFAPNGSPAWNTNDYLNIWICDISSGATGGLVTAGYAYLPTGGMVGSPIDGLVLDYSYGTGTGDRTATHEVGHYLGLDHPWGNGNCSPGDGISDTPPTDSPTFSCSNTSLMKCGTLTQYENFMDYSNCTMMFTNGQAAVMSGILNGVRSSLLNSNACDGTSTTGPCVPTSTQGTSDGDFIDGVVLGDINNTGSGSQGGPSYNDYSSSLYTALAPGSTYTISITGGIYPGDNFAAWIDYDGNNNFSSTEKLGDAVSVEGSETISFTFTVPTNATVGTTILRVRGVYLLNGDPDPTDPCYNYAYGETEDYGIVITGSGGSLCMPTSSNGTSDGDFIDGVVLGNINNTGSGSTTGDSYNDYTGQSTDLDQTGTHSITITSGNYVPDNFAAWIDYNGDGTLSSNEKLGEFQNAAAGESQSITFTVPTNAALGATIMRVRGVYVNLGEPDPVDPCFDYAYGETEDYGIVITGPTGIVEQSGNSITVRNFTDRKILSWPHPSAAQSLLIMDASGRIIRHLAPSGGQVTIGTATLASGIYQVVLSTSERRSVARFVVTKQ